MTLAQQRPAALPFLPAPLSPALGAEVTDFDVRMLDDRATVEAIKDYLRDCQVLVFRDQNLTAPELVRFVRLFGEPQYHVLKQFLLPETPEIYVLSNVKEEDGTPVGNAYEGMGWHTDLRGPAKDTAYTVLYGVQIERGVGDTCFASMYKAYEALPAAKRRDLEGLKCIYNYATQYAVRLKVLADMGVTDHQYDKPLTPEQQEYAKKRHPLPMVDVNPYSGRKWLHMATMGCAGVEGMSDKDGIKLVNELTEWSTTPSFRYDHKWRMRDLVMWDNRGLFHVAGDYDRTKHRRHIWRCLIAES